MGDGWGGSRGGGSRREVNWEEYVEFKYHIGK